MKRLLGGARLIWAYAVTKNRFVSVIGVLLIGLSIGALAAHPAKADPVDLTGNTPHAVHFVNRFYMQDDLGNYYFDGNTYDNTYEYVEQSHSDCPNKIVFNYILYGSTADDQANEDFYYFDGAPFSVKSIPDSNTWSMTVKTCSFLTTGSGAVQQQYSDNNTVTLDKATIDNRRFTFYTNATGQIVSMYSGVTFTQKQTFKGVARFFRDDEVSDANNSCPDMILLHAAQPTGRGRSLFQGGSSDIAGSSMLYSVVKDNNLNGISESYAYISAPNQITETTCHIKADAINHTKNGEYSIAGYNTNADDPKFEAAGLDQNGNTVKGGGKYGDDAFIIFIGTTENMPKDSSGAINNNPTGGNADKTDNPSCSGGSLGWLICPLVDGIQKATGLLQQALQAFLTVNPLPVTGGAIYDSWVNIRNIANILFVIAFFAIVFSQATSIGISNYGIKRLLPRLVVVAIATNLSYYVCSILIDFFNILGVGINNLFAIANNGSSGTINVSDTVALVTAGAIIGVITWAIASGAIVEIFPLLAIAFLAFVLLFVILVLRQMLLIFLVILSPVAFVAALLPGTQSWFRRWSDIFIGMLVLYPMIMGLFSVANIAAAILSAASGG